MSNETNKTAVPKLRFPEFREAGEWENFAVGEIIIQHTEKSDRNKQYPVLTSSREGILFQSDYYNNRDVASADTTGYNVVPRGFFTYRHMSDDTIFKFNINNICDRGIVSTLYPVFKAKENVVVPYFLQVVLNEGSDFQNFALSQKQGGSRTYMYLNKLRNLVIKLPAYLEQQKIAATLSSLDDLLTAQSAKLAALQAHKRGLMQGLFPAEGETVPKLRFPEFREVGEWVEKQLKDACKMQAGRFVAASNIHENKQDDLFPCYGGNGLRGYTKTFTHEGKYPLIGRQGALCGNVMLAAGQFHATEHAVVATPKATIDTDWLYYKLILLDLNQHSTGAAQPGLSVENLEKVKIKIPTTESEQQKIADCLSSLDDRITAQSQQIEALKLHKKGLMQGLFPATTDVA